MDAKKTILALGLVAGLCLASAAAPKERRAASVHRATPSQPELKPDDINNAGLTPNLTVDAAGSSVVRVQILLTRAHFSCGEIDGHFGSNLVKAVSAFQKARNLSPSGNVDGATWAQLNSDAAAALASYQIAPQDVAGPFAKIPTDMMEQAQLPALGYSSAAEELGERFHSSPKLLEQLNPGKHLDRSGEQILAPSVSVPPPPAAASIVVSKSESSVAALDAQGHVLAWYAATIGSEHDPLPTGAWKILGVQRNPIFHYNPDLFWDAQPKDQKAAIQPGPNNPVGLVWISLSKEHYGIHGTPEPGRVGHAESHGCIRLTNWDAMELAGMVKPGTPAVLQE